MYKIHMLSSNGGRYQLLHFNTKTKLFCVIGRIEYNTEYFLFAPCENRQQNILFTSI